MKPIEEIDVYINIRKGKTICICAQNNKMCGKKCPKDIVQRDKFLDWQDTFKRDKYGKSK